MQPNSTTPKRAPGRPKTPLVGRICEHCSSPYEVKPWSSARFCTPQCFTEHRRRRIVNACEQCGAPVETIPSRAKAGKGRYCSKSCFDIAQTVDLAARLAESSVRNPEGCWLWTGYISAKTGYGAMTVDGTSIHAHRIAWMVATGDTLTTDQIVMHTCDVRRCIRNDEVGVYVIDGIEYPRLGHLALGNATANMRDMAMKGRAASGDRNASRLYPERYPRGERISLAKLTADQIVEIRERYLAGNISQEALGAEYGIHQTQISNVVRRVTWKHVT